MDLHFTTATATAEERTFVDEVLGLPDSAWRGGERDDSSVRLATGARNQRHLLLPALHAVQGGIGWISHGALNYISARLNVPPAETYGVASFYALFSFKPQPPVVVHVCDDIACKTRGADVLCSNLAAEIGPPGEPAADGRATWKRSPCLGLCDRAPASFCQVADKGYRDFTLAPTGIEELRGVLMGAAPTGRTPAAEAHPPHTSVKALTRRIGAVDPTSLDDYRAAGGYQVLRFALDLGPAAVIRELTDAKLTGRGGAAFPTGVKWKAVAEAPVQPHYIVCNADESEPGTFKDRVLMEGDPFALLEAMTIAGFVIGAKKGYLYIRGEYPEATRILHSAIAQARARGLLGENILGRQFEFDVELRRGAGAYICGEETALLNSIEGKRGEPRNKPPFPVVSGLFGKPTVINNVETLLNVLPILTSRAESYARSGTERSTGTRLFCLSGCVERPGVYEVPYGTTLREVLALGGGVSGGRPLQAILLGGAAGVFVGPTDLDMPLTLEGARAAGATLGSGVVLVFDDTIDLRPILTRIAAFFRDESCGQCVPCRVGTVRQEEALQRLIKGGESQAEEIALLSDLDQVMKDASICGLGHTAASAIQSAIHRLRLFDERGFHGEAHGSLAGADRRRD